MKVASCKMFSCVHDQTIVRSKRPMSRLSCVQSCICPDYRAFKVTYDQTIVRSKLHMSRLSCVQNCICPDYRAFKIAYVQTIVRSKLHMSRLSCVQNCICPDYRAFKIAYVQTIVRSFFFPDRVILNARRHLVRSFRSGHIDFRSGTSTWVLRKLRSSIETNQSKLSKSSDEYTQSFFSGPTFCKPVQV